jgi:hypothetical protein
MRIDVNGNVGIGIATPSNGRLHVEATTNSVQPLGSFWQGPQTSIGGQFGGGSTRPVSIFGAQWIWCGFGILNTSDERIKNHISDVDDSYALDTLRLIQPKRYGYVDTLTRGSNKVLGFLAQQVESVLEDAVTTKTEFIPNIYDRCHCTPGDNGTTIVSLETKDVSFTSITDASGNELPIQIKFYDKSDKEEIRTLKNVIDSNKFILENDLPETEYFAFGQEVNNFKVLNKDAIFTINVAATQELDRQLQTAKARIQTLEETLSNVLQRLSTLENM